jgi:hypothetical protein
MTQRSRWPDLLNLIVGVWLFISPWSLALTHSTEASWTAWALGALIAAASVWAMAQPSSQLAPACAALLGLLVIISPWAFGFVAVVVVAMHNSVAVGIMVPLLAFWSLAQARKSVRLA